MSDLHEAVTEYVVDYEGWKKVITQGGRIDPYQMIVAAIRVSSVVLNEYPKVMHRIEALEKEVACCRRVMTAEQNQQVDQEV